MITAGKMARKTTAVLESELADYTEWILQWQSTALI